MRSASRTVLIGFLAISFVSGAAAATANDNIPLSRVVFEANNARYQTPVPRLQIRNASKRQREQVHRAIEMFDTARLELPPLVIRYFKDTEECRGNLGTYRSRPDGEPAVVTVCTEMRITLIHELAHAWDQHVLHDERRRRFMDHWGLDNWNDRDESWYDRGSERAADTIAYTLLHSDTDNPDILKFVCGYGILTGNDLPEPARASCGGRGVVPVRAAGVS